MPYKKKYKKKSSYWRGSSFLGDAAKALAIAKQVKSLLNVEVKNHDVKFQTTAITDSAMITQLTNIAVGDTTIQRDGSQIKMVGFDLNYFIGISGSAASTLVRVMVVLDKQTNQAIYTSADLLADATILDIVISPRNLDNMRRFTVLYDKVHTFTLSGRNVVHVKKYIKKDIIFRYDASTPDITDLTSNSLSMLTVSNEVTNDPTMTFFGRLRYIDN